MAIETTVEALDFPALILPGSMVCWGQAAAEPLALTRALMAQRAEIGGFDAFIGIGWSETSDPAFADHVRFHSYCATGTNRRLAAAGKLEILPTHYSGLHAALAPRVDVLLLQLAYCSETGAYSLGAACDYIRPLVDTARMVIAEVNDQAPFVLGPESLREDDIDIVVRTSRALPVIENPAPGEAEQAIAEIIAGLIPDGAVLQFGLGALPPCIAQALRHHRALGIHSGLMSEGMVDLIERGVVTNARKPIDTGVSVVGLLTGGARLMSFVDRNPAVSLRRATYTHGIDVLARIERFAAINAAIEVDLTGQINAEEVGGRYVGAVGGAVDFLRGAHASAGGLPIVALPATAKSPSGPVSRIVPRLNGPVSTARSDAGIIVTEHGSADLRGLSLEERKSRMIAIAAPEFREGLRQAAALR